MTSVPILLNVIYSKDSSIAITSKLSARFDVANRSLSNGEVLSESSDVNDSDITVSALSNGSWSISNNKLAFTSSNSNWGNIYLRGEKVFRALDHLRFKVQKTSATSTHRFLAGVAMNDDVSSDSHQTLCGVLISSNTQTLIHFLGRFSTNVFTYALNTEYEFIIINGGYNIDGGLSGNKHYGWYIYIKGGTFTDYTLLFKGWACYYIPMTSFSTGWQDTSLGTSTGATVVANGFRLNDNDPTLDNQVRVRSILYPNGDDFRLTHTMTITELNDSSSLDLDDDGYVGPIPPENTGDADANRVGISFPIVNAGYDLRAQLWFWKGQNYDVDGQVGIWTVRDYPGGNFEFVRLYLGTGVPIGEQITVRIEYSKTSNTTYDIDFYVNGVLLVDGASVGMNQNTSGRNSISYQAKGTDLEPVDVITHKVESIIHPIGKFHVNVHSGSGTIDDVIMKTNDITIPEFFSTETPTIATIEIHPADFWIDLHIVTRSSTGTIDYAVRYADANNYIFIRINTTGSVQVISRVSGSNTTLLTIVAGSGVTKNNIKIGLRVFGSSLQVWIDGLLAGSYATFNQLSSNTGFRFINIPVDCQISNLVCEGITIEL